MNHSSSKKLSLVDYCQYLLSTQINYTMTYFADHSDYVSHDAVRRLLENEKVTPRMIWKYSKENVEDTQDGFIIFDDTVLDKNHSFNIESVRRQYSGNEKRVIKGIGVVTCIYVNPKTDSFWIIDYRIFDPDRDGKTKIDHVTDMLTNIVCQKKLKFAAVLMDTWHAAKELLKLIEKFGKIYYCPIKGNRLIDDSESKKHYKRTDCTDWTNDEMEKGKTVKLKGLPKEHRVKLFRLALSSQRTDHVITNDMTQSNSKAVREICGFRWKIEQFHRETKQLTGIEKCQCRKLRIVRNHIGCAILAWVFLKQAAQLAGKTIYNLKCGLLDDYLRQQLRNPALKMTFA